MSFQTVFPLPTAASNFLAALQLFLQSEDASRFLQQFRGFVTSGGVHGAVAGLTGTPSPMVAWPGGSYTTETASITYADNSTTWVIAHGDTVGDIGGYTRVPGTHYLTAVVSTPLPVGCVRLMKVTTAAGAITVVVDERQLSPLVNKGAFPYVRLIGTEASAVDIQLQEASGTFAVAVNTGTEDEPSHTPRFSFVPSVALLSLVSLATVARTVRFQDKAGDIALLSDIASSAFPPGTRLLFDNDAAPVGWVRDVTIDDKVVRIVGGARVDGGAWVIAGQTIGATTLTTAQIPAHTHGLGAGVGLFGDVITGDGGAPWFGAGGFGSRFAATDANVGGGGSHAHTITSDGTWRPLNRAVIVAQKS